MTGILEPSEQLVEGECFLHHHVSKYKSIREKFGYDSFRPNRKVEIDTLSCGGKLLGRDVDTINSSIDQPSANGEVRSSACHYPLAPGTKLPEEQAST